MGQVEKQRSFVLTLWIFSLVYRQIHLSVCRLKRVFPITKLICFHLHTCFGHEERRKNELVIEKRVKMKQLNLVFGKNCVILETGPTVPHLDCLYSTKCPVANLLPKNISTFYILCCQALYFF